MLCSHISEQLTTYYDMIYLLTAIGLTPGGSSAVHIYTQTVHRTTQNKQYIEEHNNLWECGRAALGGILLKGCETSTAACEFWYLLSISSRTGETHGKTCLSSPIARHCDGTATQLSRRRVMNFI